MLPLVAALITLSISATSFAGQMPSTSPDGSYLDNGCNLRLQKIGSDYTIHKMICDDITLVGEGDEIKVTDTFSAQGKIARRAHFWKKIYNTFSIREYVIHSAEFPELVFEVVQSTNQKSANIRPKKMLRHRISQLRKTLLGMHRKGPDMDLEGESEIVRKMEHINKKNKYKVAAESLRSQRGQKEFFEGGFDAARKFIPHIKPFFSAQGIPTELAYIAFVESSFNLRAVSKVGASGVYQIMPFIARKMMTLNKKIDERRDPIKSGKVAAELFKTNLKLTGTWPLAVTSYNHGPFGIRKAIRKSGKKTLLGLIENYSSPSFGFASKNFYAEFLGALMTLQEHNLLDLNESKLMYSEIKLTHSYRVKTILSKYKITREELRSLNPDILSHVAKSNNYVIPKGYKLKIPLPKVPLS